MDCAVWRTSQTTLISFQLHVVMCVNRIEYETISGARAHLSTASIFFAAPAGTRISRGADVRHSATATKLHVLQFVPPNQQRQSTEGTAWLGVVGYYINLYSPKNGSNAKHRGTSINTNRAIKRAIASVVAGDVTGTRRGCAGPATTSSYRPIGHYRRPTATEKNSCLYVLLKSDVVCMQ